ncbi:MAG: VWA domain-containing protein, partial [Deltaproteobacteria bacterium]|nr:VWA domain-containing protein [Deltaproteobacteria bacterium]
ARPLEQDLPKDRDKAVDSTPPAAPPAGDDGPAPVVLAEPSPTTPPAPSRGESGSLGGFSGLGIAGSGSSGGTKSGPAGLGGRAKSKSIPDAERDEVRRDAERTHEDLRKEEARKRVGDSGSAGILGMDAPPRRDPAPTYTPAPVVTAPAMRAGRHDDNKQYNRFLQFLGDNSGMVVYPVNITERLVVRTLDQDGKSLHGCAVEVLDLKGKLLALSTTFADGSTQFFPADASPAEARDYALRARCGSEARNGQLGRSGRRVTDLRFGSARAVPRKVPVDIAVVIDTTGSMQSQIDRLKKTLKAIHFQLTSLSMQPDIRFGLVAYRDRGDDYVTQPYDFTRDVSAFQRVLDKLDADGGGDTPEDLQAALDDALHKLSWREDALRLGFVVADAIPHTDYGQTFTYRE